MRQTLFVLFLILLSQEAMALPETVSCQIRRFGLEGGYIRWHFQEYSSDRQTVELSEQKEFQGVNFRKGRGKFELPGNLEVLFEVKVTDGKIADNDVTVIKQPGLELEGRLQVNDGGTLKVAHVPYGTLGTPAGVGVMVASMTLKNTIFQNYILEKISVDPSATNSELSKATMSPEAKKYYDKDSILLVSLSCTSRELQAKE